jgi:hypothetical protein
MSSKRADDDDNLELRLQNIVENVCSQEDIPIHILLDFDDVDVYERYKQDVFVYIISRGVVGRSIRNVGVFLKICDNVKLVYASGEKWMPDRPFEYIRYDCSTSQPNYHPDHQLYANLVGFHIGLVFYYYYYFFI